MLLMTLIYVAGILSGIVLVAIALAGWIINIKKKKEVRGNEFRINRVADAGPAPVARHRKNDVRRRRRDSARTA